MFIHNYITSFLSYLKHERRFSPHTILAYEQDLSSFSIYLEQETGQIDIVSITHKHIRSWIVDLMNQGIIAKSINRKISTLRSFYKFLLSRKEVTVSPLTKINGLKTPARLPKFVDEKDIQTLCTEISFPEGFEGKRDKLMIELFYATGIRLSELVNINEGDIDRHTGNLKVLGKGNKERIIPLHNYLLREINEFSMLKKNLFDLESDKLFLTVKGQPVYSKMVYRKVKLYLSMVTTLEKKSPHVLRHSFATHLLNHGAELNAVKELLGHSSLAATQVYTHNTIQKLKDVHKQAHPKS